MRTLLLLSVFEGAEIGERIAHARREAGLRQEDLADLIGVSTRTIQGYEAGETSQYRRLKAIGEVLGRPVEWFLHGEPADDAEPSNAELRAEIAAVRQLLERLVDRLDQGAPQAGSGNPAG